MKIGILTFHNSYNYGSVLQCFALSNFCKNKGYEVEVINYEPSWKSKVNNLFEPNKSIKSFIKNIVKLVILPIYINRKKQFCRFINEKLTVSHQHYNEKNFKDVENNYNVIIAGSDQIWNVGCIDFSWDYLLKDLINIKKYAYAPSLGSYKLSCDEKKIFKDCLSNYKFISVREPEGKIVLDNLLPNMAVELVPDPTLLLAQNVYEELISDVHVSKPYIFLYMINMDESFIKLAIQVAKKTKLPIYTVISCPNSFYQLKYPKIKFYYLESPEMFLSLIKYSKLVLTNSFHGTAFSVILHKNFFVLGQKESDFRIKTLLSHINIKNRYLTNINDYKDESIDFISIIKLFDIYRSIGINFMNKIFNDLEKI